LCFSDTASEELLRRIAVAALALAACGRLRFGPPPEIRSFTAEASQAGWSEPLALRWYVTGADTFTLDGVGSVGSSGTVVRPTRDTDYVLRVVGVGGEVASAPLHVTVTASLSLAVGPDDAGGTRLLARLRHADGTPQQEDALIEVVPPGGERVQLRCAAGQAACSARLDEAPRAGDYTASAALGPVALRARAAAAQARIDPPRLVRAAAPDGAVSVTWEAAGGAAGYRVQLVDLGADEPVGEPVVVHGTSASVSLGSVPAQRAGISVEAWSALEPDGTPLAVSVAPGFVSAGPSGGTGARWQIFAPEDFSGESLRAGFPQLAPGERLAVIALNAGGTDRARATFEVTGTADSGPAVTRAPAVSALRASAAAPLLHEAVRAHEEAVLREALVNGIPAPAPAGSSAPPDRTSFCIARGLDFGNRVRKTAVRVLSTAHAVFYVDEEDLSHYPGGFFDTLGGLFESRAYPADRLAFGAESDVDGNGKLFVVSSHELGAHLNGGWLLGYFGNDDVLRPRDPTPWCFAGGSNGADVIFLNDVANAAANGYSADEAANSVFPATLAHELQHLINLNQRCLLRSCAGSEETWLNEGLSKVAEDLAGFGWNGPSGRSEGAQYLARGGDQLRGYDGRSLTRWEGDPIGNYQGAHSFVRYFADRRGADFGARLVRGRGGVPGMESVLHMPFARAMADWATALLFSNEGATPDARFDYLGAGWSPLHVRLRHLEWEPLPAAGAEASLRTDGLAVLVTGPSAGGPATITVRSSESVKPHVVVARFAGDLPR